MQLSFCSIHSLASDYIVIDESDRVQSCSQESRPKLASALCDRRGVAGADGVVFITADRGGNDASLQIFTPSGQESELCINGVLSAARYLTDKLDKDRVAVGTASGTVEINRADTDASLPMLTSSFVAVKRGLEPPYVAATLPFLWDTTIDQFTPAGPYFGVEVRGPHLICIVPKVQARQLEEIGTLANARTDMFPLGMNVTFVSTLDSGICYVRTFERGGAGLTTFCATAMLAASYVLFHRSAGDQPSEQKAFCPGGVARCEIADDDHQLAKLTVPCLYAYTAEIEYNPDTCDLSGWLDGRCNDDEALAYQRFKDEIDLNQIEARVVEN